MIELITLAIVMGKGCLPNDYQVGLPDNRYGRYAIYAYGLWLFMLAAKL